MTRPYARKPITKASHEVALKSLMIWRTKPIAEKEIPGIARSFDATVETVRELAREHGLLEGW